MVEEKIPISHARISKGIDHNEAGLLWDEYKYRHDLIWKHLIRSTTAVIALITVSFVDQFSGQDMLFVIAALLAIVFTLFNFYIINNELAHYQKVKQLHRQRQNELYNLYLEEPPLHKDVVGNFPIALEDHGIL